MSSAGMLGAGDVCLPEPCIEPLERRSVPVHSTEAHPQKERPLVLEGLRWSVLIQIKSLVPEAVDQDDSSLARPIYSSLLDSAGPTTLIVQPHAAGSSPRDILESAPKTGPPC